MEISENIVEYYDELFPVTESQKSFYADEMSLFPKPVKMLRVGCGTGTFEHTLAKDGIDVTGLETFQTLLDSANRKRRTQLMSLRFFQMSTLEMARFLGKGFYHIISMLDGRIILIHDQTLIRKFFFDCKQLLAKVGHLILSLPNFEKFSTVPMATLPDRKSIRTSLFTQVWTRDNGEKTIQFDLENSSGKVVPLIRDEPIYPLTKTEIAVYAKEAGFVHCEFYADFKKTPFSQESDYLYARIF